MVDRTAWGAMFEQSKDESLFEYWLSFWPWAPAFGVRWRFADAAPGMEFFDPAGVAAKMSAAGATEAHRATDEAIDAAKETVKKTAEVAKNNVAKAKETQAANAKAAAKAVEAAVEATAAAGAALRPAVLFEKAPSEADDLKLIKGVGPKLETMLNGMGIYTFDQIASFTEANLQWVDENLTAFKGRPFRDDWVAQAKSLK